MRIKLGENLPAALVERLGRHGHEVDAVPAEGLSGRDDEEVWRAAQENGAFLITQDLDFSDVRQFQPGTHHGLLLVRLREPGRLALIRRLCAVFENDGPSEWRGCFVVVTERKTRVRRPPAR